MQVSSTLISSDGASDPESLAINAASAAVSASDIPWLGAALPSPLILTGNRAENVL